ncbi:MAG: putative toxin-antitoxin system toxin component, PIN family [Chloroflexi bacterium]|nr:putative toxin-antitoxin system toxin component, PIN family [Chloroflexota bacterium]
MDNLVLDTNVVISALRSNRGASAKLFSLIGTGRFDISLSVPLVLEYEDVLERQAGAAIALSKTQIGDVLDYLCSAARHFRVYYLWRPLLRDSHDDMVLELAVTAECKFIVTYNLSDFVGIERFGIEAITPKVLLERMGELS